MWASKCSGFPRGVRGRTALPNGYPASRTPRPYADLRSAAPPYLLTEYVRHYNGRRPHRARDLRPPRPTYPPNRNHQRITRRPVLDGLINEYERAAKAATQRRWPTCGIPQGHSRRPRPVSLATIMGPVEMWFCHGDGTRVLPLMGAPGVASRLPVVRPLWSPHGLPGGVRDRSERDFAVVAGGPVGA